LVHIILIRINGQQTFLVPGHLCFC